MTEDEADHAEVVYNADGTYCLQWWCADNADLGAILGETVVKLGELNRARNKGEPGDAEYIAACVAVQTMTPKPRRDSAGFVWRSEQAAFKACEIANAAAAEERARNKPDKLQTVAAPPLQPSEQLDPQTALFQLAKITAEYHKQIEPLLQRLGLKGL